MPRLTCPAWRVTTPAQRRLPASRASTSRPPARRLPRLVGGSAVTARASAAPCAARVWEGVLCSARR